MITKDQLTSHELWLEGDPKGERISLPGVDLFGANLFGVVGLTIAEEQGGQDHE